MRLAKSVKKATGWGVYHFGYVPFSLALLVIGIFLIIGFPLLGAAYALGFAAGKLFKYGERLMT